MTEQGPTFIPEGGFETAIPLDGVPPQHLPQPVDIPEFKVNPGGIEIDPSGNLSWRRTTKEPDARTERGYL